MKDAACTNCGRIVHTGEAKVLVALTTKQLAELASNTLDVGTRRQLLCALQLLDADAAEKIW